MIYVALTCAKSGSRLGMPRCPQYEATLAPDDVARWVEATLLEHGWYTDPDSDDYFCPAHNPTDAGLIIEIGPQRAYTLLGESGWEARWGQFDPVLKGRACG